MDALPTRSLFGFVNGEAISVQGYIPADKDVTRSPAKERGTRWWSVLISDSFVLLTDVRK